MASFPGQPLEWRGIVEGFYGPPWTFEQRHEQLRFAARHGLDCYVHAPKDDPFHRARWREPYPAAQLAAIGELAHAGAELGVRFIAAIAPGLSMRYGEPVELEQLLTKAAALHGAGGQGFALLFDDLPGFSPDDRALGAAHGEVGAALAAAFPQAPLLVCPTDYSGARRSGYRDGLAATLPRDAVITWSGPAVVSDQVRAADVTAAAASYRRRVVLWDNVPVNDFDRARLYLGPLRERPADSALAGLLANPMIEPAASRITLATAAAYMSDPRGYDPGAALEHALVAEAGADASLLAPLARASDWPPDTDTGAALAPLTTAALAGDRRAARDLRQRLRPLAELPDDPPVGDIGREARPWLLAGRDLARAAGGACELLLGLGGADPSTVRAQLDRAEQHWPNVLRDTLSPFVRAVLHRLSAPTDRAGGGYAVLLGGPVPTAGEERLAAVLRRRGLAVRARARLRDDDRPALVVVSRSAERAAAVEAATCPAPLLALFHLQATGLATRAGVLLREERVRVVAPDHPLAAGRTGAVRVFRGPAMARWGEPGPDATVIARAEEEDWPVIVHYPAGARLASGVRAREARAALFLGRDLLAPWVITDEGVALTDAAVGALLTGAGSSA